MVSGHVGMLGPSTNQVLLAADGRGCWGGSTARRQDATQRLDSRLLIKCALHQGQVVRVGRVRPAHAAGLSHGDLEGVAVPLEAAARPQELHRV